MNLEDLLAVVWRRRVAFLAMFVVAVAAVVLATLSLPKVYESTATIYVGGQETDQAENVDTNFGQQIARTYAALASGATVADRVRAELPGRPSRTELLGRMTFAPVEQTRLLQITAEGSTPEAAARTANVYARGFVSHVATLQAQNSAPSKATLVETAAAPTDPAAPERAAVHRARRAAVRAHRGRRRTARRSSGQAPAHHRRGRDAAGHVDPRAGAAHPRAAGRRGSRGLPAARSSTWSSPESRRGPSS